MQHNQPLNLDAIEAVINAASQLGADITPETARALVTEVRRLRAELGQERQNYEAYRIGAEGAKRMLANRLNAITELLDQQELAARGFEVSVPEWVTVVRRAVERGTTEPTPAAEVAHVVADDSSNPEHTDDRPGLIRPCGHDDYHDPHDWHDRPGVWCPGISYADDDAPATRPAAGEAR